MQSPDVTRTDLLEVDQEPSPSVGEPGAREFIYLALKQHVRSDADEKKKNYACGGREETKMRQGDSTR